MTDRPGNSVFTPADPLPPPIDLLTPLQTGILQAVSYADVFDYPLTLEEIHRYLVGITATRSQTRAALDDEGYLVPDHIERHGELYTLPGRSALVRIRRSRARAAETIWARARYYGRLIARLPFVQMVAVTGALAVSNTVPGDDIDYLIVTSSGRLWLCRAFVILLVKVAAWRGDIICPNYFLAEEALGLPERDLFTAHELAQMVPVVGQTTYEQMLSLNDWARGFLPNAASVRCLDAPATRHLIKTLLEIVLSTQIGDWLERWEMSRKIARFNQHRDEVRQPADAQYQLSEMIFSATQCKGHFNRHGEQTLKAYSVYLQQLENSLMIDHP